MDGRLRLSLINSACITHPERCLTLALPLGGSRSIAWLLRVGPPGSESGACRRSEIQWCGTTVDHRRFACARPGAAIDFILSEECHDAVLLVKPEVLVGALSQQAVDLLTGGRTIDFTAVGEQRLIAAIAGAVHKYAKSPQLRLEHILNGAAPHKC